jgi:hypothetical protein
MSERTSIEQAVSRAISQALDRRLPQLREEVANSVMEEIAPLLEKQSGGASADVDGSENLLKAVEAIHHGNTQREILRALLDNTVRYSGRSALFVIKGATATGWEGRGFSNNDEVKNFALSVGGGVAARALESRTPFSGSADEIDHQFRDQFRPPGDGKVHVLPLLLKDKVAALLYADSGADSGGQVHNAALELLVNSTSAWLEVTSLRKQSQKDGAETAAPEKNTAPPVQTVSSFSDPFAGHAPLHSAKAAAAEPAPVAAAAAAAASGDEAKGIVVSTEAPPEVPVSNAIASLPPEQAEIHRKAQRFARLLVDEIKLYNQAKVSDGRKNRDLYDRLKEDIEKSRATYQKRYGNTAASGTDYFSNELVRSLAADDSSLMGANFRR